MADGYEPLRGGQPGFDALMQMLVNMERQGAIEKQMAWQGLGRGIEGLGGGIGAARAETRQRDFTAQQQRVRDAARARQATVDYNRGRGTAREQRGFDERMLNKQLAAGKYGGSGDPTRLDDDIARLMKDIAEGNAAGLDTSGLKSELDRKLKARGDPVTAPPPDAPPPPGPGPVGPPSTIGEVAARRRADAIAAEKAKVEMGKIAAANTAEMAPLVRTSMTANGDVAQSLAGESGLTVRERAAQKEFTERRINDMGTHIGTVLAEEGNPILALQGPVPKSVPGKLLHSVTASLAKGLTDEEQIVRKARSYAEFLWRNSAEGKSIFARLGKYPPVTEKFMGLDDAALRAWVRRLKQEYIDK